MTPSSAGEKADWPAFALQYKARIQELLHRELVYQGIITAGMSYSATLLAVFGLANRGLELD